jgi:hypothetical protein
MKKETKKQIKILIIDTAQAKDLTTAEINERINYLINLIND